MSVVAQPAASSAVGARLATDAHHLARAVLVGTGVGVLSLGVVGRLAMLLLARVNPSTAGMVTDDGFVIDQFTLSGSMQLAATGGAFGALSGVLHTALAPLKIGRMWFRRLSFSVGAGVVVASFVIHSDGIDFRFLDRPALGAAAMFVAIPVLHVLALDLGVERVRRRGLLRARGWTAAGLVLTLPFAPLVLALALGRAGYLLLCARGPDSTWTGPGRSVAAWLARTVLAVLFVLAALSIVADVRAVA